MLEENQSEFTYISKSIHVLDQRTGRLAVMVSVVNNSQQTNNESRGVFKYVYIYLNSPATFSKSFLFTWYNFAVISYYR